MKRGVTLKSHLSVEQIGERLYGSNNGHHASYGPIILTVSLHPGKATKQYCAYLGISATKFYRIVALYNEHGASFCGALLWGGRREPCCLMSLEQEEELLQTWATCAVEGGVLMAGQLREAVEQKVAQRISDDYLCDMLHRHGWSTKAPRPQHPKAAEAKEKTAAFKKSTCLLLFKPHSNQAAESFL